MVLNMPEKGMGSGYVVIYTKVLTSEDAWICQNIPECGKICLNMSNVVNMVEYA